MSYPGTRPNGAGHEGAGYQSGSRAPSVSDPANTTRGSSIGYNDEMHRRTSFVVGLAVGYYFGARAGRERYEEIRAVLDDIPIGRAVEKARALAELAIVRVQEARDERSATVLPFPNAAGE